MDTRMNEDDNFMRFFLNPPFRTLIGLTDHADTFALAGHYQESATPIRIAVTSNYLHRVSRKQFAESFFHVTLM